MLGDNRRGARAFLAPSAQELYSIVKTGNERVQSAAGEDAGRMWGRDFNQKSPMKSRLERMGRIFL